MRSTLLGLTLASLLVAGCGDSADLETAVATDVRGASIDGIAQPASPASAQPASPASAQPESPASAQPASPESAQPESPESAQPESPDSAQPESPDSAQPESPDTAQPESPDTAQPESPDSAQPESPESGQPETLNVTPDEVAAGLGDQSTAADDADTPVDPDLGAQDETTAADESAGDDAAAAADAAILEEPPLEIPKPVLEEGVWVTTFEFLADFDPGILAVAEDSNLAQHTPSLPEREGAKPLRQGIPDEVLELDGKQVRVEGYMIPLKFDDGKVKSFFLSRYMMGCCFGVLPKANEVIEVEMTEEGAYYDAYMPFLVTGKMYVMPDGTDDEKYLKTIYVMKATKCEYAEEW